jgi:hypothetical protein
VPAGTWCIVLVDLDQLPIRVFIHIVCNYENMMPKTAFAKPLLNFYFNH